MIRRKFVFKKITRPIVERRAGEVRKVYVEHLLADHTCAAADPIQNIIDRVGNRCRAAAGIQKTDCPWIRRNVFHHERAGISAVQE